MPARLYAAHQPDISLECQVSATGLKSADLNEKSDPYVRLTLAGQQAKSKTIMKSLDPQWDETFEFVGVRGKLVMLCPSRLFTHNRTLYLYSNPHIRTLTCS